MLSDFKKFLLRGNVVDLAVAVVIGAAFAGVVSSFVEDVVNPVIGLVGGQDFGSLVITLKDATADGDAAVQLRYGQLISAIVNFVLVAAAVFFVVVKPMQLLIERRAAGQVPEDETPEPSDEAVLLAEIRDLLASRGA